MVMTTPAKCWVAALSVCFFVSLAQADLESHRYKEHSIVPVHVNKVGPRVNPSEIYSFYDLPFCRPDSIKHEDIHLGDYLKGDRVMNSKYHNVQFKDSMPIIQLCEEQKTRGDLCRFRDAILEDYFFEMYVDALPVWHYVGEVESDPMSLTNMVAQEERVYLFTKLDFSLAYNGDRVIEVNVTADPAFRKDITDCEHGPDEESVSFHYSTQWQQTDIKFEDRMEKYHRQHQASHSKEIHWLSIINSFILVLLLTGFLAMILLRVLRNDMTKYMDDDVEGLEEEETGWKLINHDVFRFPRYPSLFASVLGVGFQILFLLAGLILLSLSGVFKPYSRGLSINSAFIMMYALTATVGGFVSAAAYKKLGGTRWVWNVFITTGLFAMPFFTVAAFLNTVAIVYNSRMAMPFLTILAVIAIWALVSFPLTVVGSIAGRNWARPFEAPCRTKNIPREIPPCPWYRTGFAQILMAGFLPFSAIYIELHYIFASVWGHKLYTLYGILFLAFLMLIIVTAFITIAMTYFQLAIEDHQWWWRSVLSGGSTGFFVYAYCFFYYFERSEMTGFMQASFFFGYMAMFSFALFLMLGAVGFSASFVFVKTIYSAIKSD